MMELPSTALILQASHTLLRAFYIKKARGLLVEDARFPQGR
jgi:hypothetical protein